ncbi:MAG: hypothetical protein CMJ23_04110 [Phycisphaerae bacterium]|nr:hypothetical protein [Phycisphaerae bacterium]
MPEVVVTTFYRFIRLEDPASLQAGIETCCEQAGVRGIILLAEEGINATIAGERDGITAVLDFLQRDPRFTGLTVKESITRDPPFRKMRVRIKREIITMGVPGIDPEHLTGTYVAPEDWNELINDPEVIVIDTRNDYEVQIGSFRNAIDPDIRTFGQLPAWLAHRIDAGKQPRVAMFCTGGIRCEKSTAYLKQAGVREVYHLEGGILRYLERVPEAESLWHGECFVFDERVSVGHGLVVGSHDLCRACRRPISESDKESDLHREGVSCPRCHAETTETQKAGFAERGRQVEIARARGDRHLAD